MLFWHFRHVNINIIYSHSHTYHVISLSSNISYSVYFLTACCFKNIFFSSYLWQWFQMSLENATNYVRIDAVTKAALPNTTNIVLNHYTRNQLYGLRVSYTQSLALLLVKIINTSTTLLSKININLLKFMSLMWSAIFASNLVSVDDISVATPLTNTMLKNRKILNYFFSQHYLFSDIHSSAICYWLGWKPACYPCHLIS